MEKEIGRGGFAVVYKGTFAGQLVAVKQLLAEMQHNPEEGGEKDERVKFSDYFAEFRREVWLMRYLSFREESRRE